MGFKDLKCWAKGGIVFTIIFLVLLITYFVLPLPMFSLNKDLDSIGIIFSFPLYLGVLVSSLFFVFLEGKLNTEIYDFLFQVSSVVFSLILYFFIGAGFGWICDRIRNKDKTVNCMGN